MSEPEAESSQAASTAVSPPHSFPASRQNAIPAAAGTGHEDHAQGTSLAPAAALREVVQPSSFLRRPRAISRPMTPSTPLNAVDREQIDGLVSYFKSFELYDRTVHGMRHRNVGCFVEQYGC